MVIVATAGGGIRAAYWTATVLEELDRDLKGACVPTSSPSVASPAAASVPQLSMRLWCNATRSNVPGPRAVGRCRVSIRDDIPDRGFPRARSCEFVFVDTPASLLPDFGQSDRGAALERSFETASGGLLRRPFLSFFPYDKDPAVERQQPWRPILLLNATNEETGKRIITVTS